MLSCEGDDDSSGSDSDSDSGDDGGDSGGDGGGDGDGGLVAGLVGTVGSLIGGTQFPSRAYGWVSVHSEGEPVAMSKTSSEAGADAPATEILTAVAILNREGHAPGAAHRSAQPQHRRGVDRGGEPDKRGAARRGAVAGGALLAGGAALGAAIFANSEPTAGETAPAGGDGGEGAFPDQGLLGPEVFAEAAPPGPVVIDPAATSGSLGDAAPVASLGALAGVPTGTDTAHPAAGEGGAASASPEPSGHDAAPSGSGGAGGGDDTAFGSGSGGDTSDGDTSGGDTDGGDTEGGDEGGLLGVGSEEGILNTGLLASDSESSSDESEASGESGGEDDGGGGLLDTGLLG